MSDLIKAADRLANFSEDYANGLIASEDFRSAITAYRTARDAGEDTRAAPKVKPLVWKGCWAKLPIGDVQIALDDRGFYYRFGYIEEVQRHETQEGAIANFNKKYESDMISALE